MMKTLKTKLDILYGFLEFAFTDENKKLKYKQLAKDYVNHNFTDEITQAFDTIVNEKLEERMRELSSGKSPSNPKNAPMSVNFINDIYRDYLELKPHRFDSNTFGCMDIDGLGNKWYIKTYIDDQPVKDQILKCDELGLEFRTQDDFFEWRDYTSYSFGK